MNNINFLWLGIIIVLEACALYYVKKYATDDNKIKFLFMSVILYAIIPYLLYKITKDGTGIAITNTIWNIVSTIYGLLIGIIIFNEHITTEQKVGITFGTIGILFMVWKNE